MTPRTVSEIANWFGHRELVWSRFVEVDATFPPVWKIFRLRGVGGCARVPMRGGRGSDREGEYGGG